MIHVVHSLITDENAWKVLGLALSLVLDLLRQTVAQRKARPGQPLPADEPPIAADPAAPLYPSRRVGELHRAAARRRRIAANVPSTGTVRLIAQPGRAASSRMANRRRPGNRRS
ncbi:hypothetical protein [Kitasatospora sp. NPDC057015]|uniref:hypothetical protein n=1 Tax=Kitasatospora sp. NPDC057015 TaxID=3346001 RepID=UPI00363D2ED2